MYKDELEVLIVDDGSKDDTAEIAKRYEERYPNTFKLVKKENGGWGSTLNKGIEIGTGKYFKQLDGDDYFSHENLDDFILYLKKYKCRSDSFSFHNFFPIRMELF